MPTAGECRTSAGPKLQIEVDPDSGYRLRNDEAQEDAEDGSDGPAERNQAHSVHETTAAMTAMQNSALAACAETVVKTSLSGL